MLICAPYILTFQAVENEHHMNYELTQIINEQQYT